MLLVSEIVAASTYPVNSSHNVYICPQSWHIWTLLAYDVPAQDFYTLDFQQLLLRPVAIQCDKSLFSLARTSPAEKQYWFHSITVPVEQASRSPSAISQRSLR